LTTPEIPRPLIRSLRPDYRRGAATRDVSFFAGWDYLIDLVEQTREVLNKKFPKRIGWLSYDKNKAGRPPREITENDVLMHQAFISTLFLFGARIREIIGLYGKNNEEISPPLKKSNIRLDISPDRIYVENLPVLKHYKKVDYDILYSDKPVVSSSREFLWHYNKERKIFERKIWLTRRLYKTRTFFFPKDEPLVKYLLGWLNICEDETVFKYGYNYWYNFIVSLDPMIEKYGSRVREFMPTDKSMKPRNIYPHWFRAQRASQLALEYSFSLHRLLEWFGWMSVGIAVKYASLGSPPEDKMFTARTTWRSRTP